MKDYMRYDILRTAIEKYLAGDYENPRRHRPTNKKCSHGVFYWDACENCTDAHFQAALDRANAI